MGLRDDVQTALAAPGSGVENAIRVIADFLDPPPPPVPTENEVAEQTASDAKDAQIADLQAQLAAAQSATAAAQQAEASEDAPVPPDGGGAP